MSEAQETELREYAAKAELSPLAIEAVLLYVDGCPYGKIATALRVPRKEANSLVTAGARSLSRHIPNFWSYGHAFARDLSRLVKNRRVEDETGLHGVAPAYDVATHLPSADLVPSDHPALRQPVEYGVRLWGRSLTGASA